LLAIMCSKNGGVSVSGLVKKKKKGAEEREKKCMCTDRPMKLSMFLFSSFVVPCIRLLALPPNHRMLAHSPRYVSRYL